MSDILRSQPRQARSKQTFDAILSAAAELLDERGWEGFNTNLLAERAGCRVSAVYRYFPDKLAVVTTLAEKVVGEWGQQLADFDQALGEKQDIRVVWPEYLHRFISSVEQQQGALAIRRAMQATPALRAIDQADNERMAALMAHQLANYIPGLSAAEAATAARVLIESAVPLIDLALDSSPAESERIRRQLEIMHDSYLERLLRTH